MLAEKRGKFPVTHGDIHAVLMNPTDWLSYIVGDGFGAAVDNMFVGR
jgi:hypothetical protein